MIKSTEDATKNYQNLNMSPINPERERERGTSLYQKFKTYFGTKS